MSGITKGERRCRCEDAQRNRRKRRPEPATFASNADGEVVCAFCWVPIP